MTLQKGSLNGHPILEDTASPGVPVIDAAQDGGDIVVNNAAVLAIRRPSHVCATVAAMQAIATPYLVNGQTYQTLEYATGTGGGKLYRYNSTGKSGITVDSVRFIAGLLSDDYYENITDYPNQETVTGATPALSLDLVSLIDASSNTVDATLADGAYITQRKVVIATDVTNAITVTVANHDYATSYELNLGAVGDTLIFEWTGSVWTNIVVGVGVVRIVRLANEAAYTALTPKDPDTVYVYPTA